MPEYLRALTYILAMAIPVFMLAKKVAVPLIEEDEFRRWRNCWIAITCAAFLTNSFFIFVAITLLIAIYIHRTAKQPIFFYIILMFAAPCVHDNLGIPGVLNKVIEVNPPRLLELFILLPVGVTLLRNPKNRQLGFFDLLIGAFFLLLALLAFRHGDMNSIVRAILQYFVDIILPYFVFSRAIQSAKDLNKILLAFAVAAMPLAAVGLFETWKGWRLYYIVVQQWGFFLNTPYLLRDDLLRAATTAIQPISFGFLCMTGAACILISRSKSKFSVWHYASLGLLLAGLLSSLSRGPWLGFAVFAVVALALRPTRAARVLAGLIPLAVGAAYLLPSAIVQRFTNLLPFIGSADKGSENYRSELFANAMIVIERYPLFGSQSFIEEPEMQRMLQGEGIVDVVNTYLQIALNDGLVGLFLYLAFFVSVAVFLFVRTARPAAYASHVNIGGLLALLSAMLFTIATTSSVSIIPFIIWAFAGTCVSVSRLGNAVSWDDPVKAPAKMKVLRAL